MNVVGDGVVVVVIVGPPIRKRFRSGYTYRYIYIYVPCGVGLWLLSAAALANNDVAWDLAQSATKSAN